MRKGIRVGRAVRRTAAAMFVPALVVVVVKEMPGMRRYMKTGM